jgi:hypothetical protein
VSKAVVASKRSGRITPAPEWGPEISGVRSGPTIVITGTGAGREAEDEAPESKATKQGRRA